MHTPVSACPAFTFASRRGKMPTQRTWILPALGLALMALVPVASHAARSRAPVPPVPPSPPIAAEAPAVPEVPAPALAPRVPLPPLPPDEADWAEAPDADQVHEWFGDLDPETLELAGPPDAGGDDLMGFL